MGLKLRVMAGLAVLGVMAGLLAGCATGQATVASPTEPAGAGAVTADSGVIAEGKVVPDQEASLSFTTGGVIGEVLVTEGAVVQAGQPLMRLTGGEKLRAAVSAAEFEQLTAQQALDDLIAHTNQARSQAQLALATAQKALEKAKDRVYSKDYTRGSPDQVDIARANYIIAQDGVSKAEDLYNKMGERSQDDPVRAEAFSQVAAARQKRDVALANLNYLLNKPDQLDVNEVTAQLAVAQANVDDAQHKLDLLVNGPDANQLALAQARLKNAGLALDAAKAGLADLELRAPFAGSVTGITAHTGEYAAPGVPALSLADLSHWQVNTTDLTELNVARISVGQPAVVRFDALPGLDIIGRVTQIKPLGENRQGDVVYTAVLKLENSDPRLRWNMTAAVTFLEKAP